MQVVSAAGAVEHEQIVEQVKRLFTNLSTDPITAADLVEREPAVFTGSEVRKVQLKIVCYYRLKSMVL